MPAATLAPPAPPDPRTPPRATRVRWGARGPDSRAAARWLAPGIARRVFALLLITVFSIGCVEPLIADVHDGDAPESEVAAASAGLILTGSPPVASAAPSSPADDGSTGDSSDDAPESRDHAHVCHCTHAHGGTLTAAASVVASVAAVDDAPLGRSDRLPPSPSLELQLRPPVRLHAA